MVPAFRAPPNPQATASPTRVSGCAPCMEIARHSRSAPRRVAELSRRCGFRSTKCPRVEAAMQSPKWRVLIADDEPAARRGVRQLLAPFDQFAVVGECRDGREVLAALDSLKPDVLFLDIQMPEVDGFEVIRRRSPNRMPAIVFLTAYDQFAIRAFEAEAQDYLLKPVTEGRFAATMKRLARRLSEGPVREKSL